VRAVPPLLSIVTPCLNRAAFLGRALASVAGQAVEPGLLEHVVIDGGSTDGSVPIIERHAAANPGLVSAWRSEPDAGQSDALNRGFALARGVYGGWLNADDWYEPGGLRAVIGALAADPGIDVLVARCRFVDESGRVVFSPRPPEPVSPANLMRLRSRWFNGRSLVQPEVFFRLSLFREVGGLDPANHYSMDHDLWLRMAVRGARFVTIDALVANLGVHPGQKTRDNRAVVRSVLAHTRDAAERYAGLLGPEAGPVRDELEAMRRKLDLADLAIARWESARRGVDGSRSVEAAAAYDELTADTEIGRRVAELAAPARAAHAGPAAEALAAAARKIRPGAARVLVVAGACSAGCVGGRWA
jgi:GT2 family glycosyltransferase